MAKLSDTEQRALYDLLTATVRRQLNTPEFAEFLDRIAPTSIPNKAGPVTDHIMRKAWITPGDLTQLIDRSQTQAAEIDQARADLETDYIEIDDDDMVIDHYEIYGVNLESVSDRDIPGLVRGCRAPLAARQQPEPGTFQERWAVKDRGEEVPAARSPAEGQEHEVDFDEPSDAMLDSIGNDLLRRDADKRDWNRGDRDHVEPDFDR